MEELKISNLSYDKQGIKILKDINLTAAKKSITALIGPSGSGKSTLLHMYNRMLEPTRGEIYYHGMDIRDIDVIQLRKELGMVFQQPYLFQGTVEDNLAFSFQIAGKTFDKEIGKKYLSLVGLNTNLIESRIEHLSG